MPYRHAHWFVLALFPFIGLAFWPAYLSTFSAASVAFHVHGFTAMLWILWLAAQSWSIHNGRRDLHRSVGMASLGLFPLFMGGAFLIERSMAWKYASGSDPFYEMWGPELGLLDITAAVVMPIFFMLGLKNRRKVHLHAGYLLATVIFLLSPIFGRLAAIPLGITGPDTFERFGVAVQLGNGVALTASLLLWSWNRKHGAPWMLAATVTAAQMLLIETVGKWARWEHLFASTGAIPEPVMFSAGLLVGATAAWIGWNSVPGRSPPIGAVPAR